MNKTPAVRFIGFAEDWEQRKLGDVLVLLKDGTHGTHKDAESGPLLLSAKNIKNGTIQWDESDRRISEDEYNNIHSNFKLQKGDVLLTIVGSIGETAILSQSKGVTFQRSVAFLRPSDKISSEFLYSEIQGQKFQKALNVRKSTSAQPGIYLGDLRTIPIEFPTSDEEQMQIGSYFQNLDNLITLHQRKYEKLKNIKKSMLEKMFPKNDSNVPEIRFKGFTDAWEQRQLGELGTITTGSTPSTAIPDYYSDDGIVWVTPTDICENITFESARKLSDLGQQVGRVVPKNTILVTCIASIGKNTMLGNTGSFNQQINGLTPNENECDPYFLLTESALWSAKMKSSAAAGTMQIVNRTEFSELKTWLPSLIEQQAISDFFRQLDHLITLHHRKLKKLEQIKQAMLHKMFV